MPKVYIRFNHNQVGMLIEASTDRANWQTVELQKYAQFRDETRPYDSFISTTKQEDVYLASLAAKKIEYEVLNRQRSLCGQN